MAHTIKMTVMAAVATLTVLVTVGCDLLDAKPKTLAFGPDESVTLSVAPLVDTSTRYERDSWQNPADVDGDCMNTRHEVLAAQSEQSPVLSANTRHEVLAAQSEQSPVLSADGCYVSSGLWTDPYSGMTFTDPRDLQIDHIVPLHQAHKSGGAGWSAARKSEFANSLDNLVAVEERLNQEKGSDGPDEWKPPARDHWCEYARTYATVKARWGLAATTNEYAALLDMSGECF